MAHYEPSHLDLRCLQKLILSPVAAKELKAMVLNNIHEIQELDKPCISLTEDENKLSIFDLL